jgi:Uma2 family endonuclease
MDLRQKSDRRSTYAEYLTWPEDERRELMDGVAYAMTPAPGRRHQSILVELSRQVANLLQGADCRPYSAPFDVRLPEGDEADEQVVTVVQPDLAVVCDPAKLDDAGCRGAPDWIVEVLSPATASRDPIEKRALYARHGVKE